MSKLDINHTAKKVKIMISASLYNPLLLSIYPDVLLLYYSDVFDASFVLFCSFRHNKVHWNVHQDKDIE